MEFKTYGKIKQLGSLENKDIFSNPEDTIYVQEKIDGANFRFMFSDGRIIFGSRTQSVGDSEQEIGGNWRRCVEHIKLMMAAMEVDFSEYEGLIFFGECCVKHSIHYDFDRMPSFLGFDIYDTHSERYFSFENCVNIFSTMGLSMVPTLGKFTAKEMTSNPIEGIKSQYYDGEAEGLVFKNYDTQIFAKFVTDKFKEVNKEHFGARRKDAENDDELLVNTYCPNARIDKHIFKLKMEGRELELKLMDTLPKLVCADIMEENWQEILSSSWKLDLRNVRRLITKRCLTVLKDVMFNTTLNEVSNETESSVH